MIVYTDTSALLKLVLREPESAALRSWVAGSSDTLVGSQLVHTEAHCGVRRRVEDYDPARVDAALGQLSVVPLDARDLRRAATARGGCVPPTPSTWPPRHGWGRSPCWSTTPSWPVPPLPPGCRCCPRGECAST